MSEMDISHERVREYIYPDGYKYQVWDPATLTVAMDHHCQMSHVIVDKKDATHHIGAGWRILHTTKKKEDDDLFWKTVSKVGEK